MATTAKIPAPNMPRAAGSAKFSGKTIVANPNLIENNTNPRRPGTHGHKVFSYVLKAGYKGISYEDLRNAVAAQADIKGFSNHLAWDADRNFILVREDYADEYDKLMKPAAAKK
jgi:hypothetical protein